jgi:predicted GNAT superfamily acetyltransferase
MATGVPLINPPVAGEPLRSAPIALAGEERRLIQIPSDFQSLKARDRNLALEWRLHTRALFEEAFAGGYLASDLLLEDGRSYYLLEMAMKN